MGDDGYLLSLVILKINHFPIILPYVNIRNTSLYDMDIIFRQYISHMLLLCGLVNFFMNDPREQ